MMPFILSGAFLGIQDWVSDMIGKIATGLSEWNVGKYAKLASGSDNIIMGTPVWNFIGKAYDALKGIGIALAVTVFILNIIDLASKDNATFENFVRQILNIVFTIAAINMGEYIVNIFIGINDGLVDTILRIKMTGKEQLDTIPGIVGLGIVEALVALIILLIPALVGLIADAALMFPLISRCLEVAWRCVFLPIGMCNFTGGAQSPAMRYTKNLIGALLTGAFYAVMLKIGASMAVSLFAALFKAPEGGWEALGEGFTKIWQIVRDVLLIIVLKFAVLGVMMSGTRAMKEVIG